MTTPPRPMRKDQLRNRRLLLDAARAAFAEEGPDLAIDAIARRAGVSPSTFYRHFPTKDALVDQLLDELTDGARQVAARAAGIPDPWEAFRTVFTHGCVLEETELRLFDILCRTSPQAARHGHRATADLIAPAADRARDAGRLRPDVSVEDIAAFMRMADSAADLEQRRRAQDVLLAGMRDAG
ncbi:TetR/AcrR family transcriptional regulator [Kitasatospora sp. NPDC008050]|uniref:TetR/AcrR family transcriptional regulator n=1 Tax=Kitasatospora sp. NPDC008050 TaxID=3364021 RepID=UPI0036EE5560